VLPAVPPRGVAANLLRAAGAGEAVDPDDSAAQSRALEALIDRRDAGGLPDIDLPSALAGQMSRRARARELADVLRGLAE
jgi:hypothetical protein